MIEKIAMELRKRKESLYQHYYSGIGHVLRKKRLSLNMTQEEVAHGICSNTYLSKIENNQVNVSEEHVFLLLEKMDGSIDDILLPEDLIYYLKEALKLFFFLDVDGYKEIYEKCKKYDLSVVILLINFGYYILTEDYDNGKIAYGEIFRYLCSLENYGLSVFFLFACYYSIGVRNYRETKAIIDLVDIDFRFDDIMFALFNFCKFIVYGSLELTTIAFESGNLAKSIFDKYMNFKRISEFFIWREMFKIFDGHLVEENIRFDVITNVCDSLRNLYLVVLASASSNPVIYLKYMSKEEENYSLGLFFVAKYYLENEDIESYKAILSEINSVHYQVGSKIDYGYILKLIKRNDEIYLKDYLINYVLTHAQKKCNLYFLRVTTDYISKILHGKKRYKDALSYQLKLNDYVKSLKNRRILT